MWIIAGLGNPDASYVGTRHNAGRDLLIAIAKKERLEDFEANKRLHALVTKGTLFGAPATLVCPDTMMNNSGQAVKPLVKSVKQAAQLIVIHDELDLPIGAVKLSFGSGAGGHKGVDSIQRLLRTRDFVRVRVGISPRTSKGKARKPDSDDVIDFVLGKFRTSELEHLKKAQTLVVDALHLLLTEGLPRAMTEINARSH